MKLVSVIIPCYNVENVIGNCIKSLVNQTIGLGNLELIFVNDASTDDTLAILSAWEQRYPESILVVNCEDNGKIGRARNIGMTYATGKYLGFVDADDIVEENMYHDMYCLAEQQNADMVNCTTRRCTLEEYQELLSSGKNKCRTKEHDWVIRIENDEQRLIYLKGDVNASACNRLFRKEMIDSYEIRFLEGMMYEDIYFTQIVRRYVRVVCGIEEIFYNHILYQKSVSVNDDQSKKEEFLKSRILTYKELQKRELYEVFAGYYDQKLMSDYIAYVYACFRMFGKMDMEQWMRGAEMMRDVIDCTREYETENEKISIEVQKLILESTRRTLSEEEVQELAFLIQNSV